MFHLNLISVSGLCISILDLVDLFISVQLDS